MRQRFKVWMYMFLGSASAYLLYWIVNLNEQYSLSGGLNCFIPLCMGVLTAIYGVVKWFLSRYK